jgi:hypothetical protein
MRRASSILLACFLVFVENSRALRNGSATAFRTAAVQDECLSAAGGEVR